MCKFNGNERMLVKSNRKHDYRNEFDHDESRLIHSAAFRRLQSKTQILGLGESDFYRTRLTHSMEVAQIGRGIVQFLKESCKDDDFKAFLPDVALISSICLAHDIGHPPFGHAGEVALNYCMNNYGGFEGNAQTLRILGKLEKYTEKNGLNPTKRMLLGVLKYPAPYSVLVNENYYKSNESDNLKLDVKFPYWFFNSSKQKPPKCYYDDDKDIIDFIMKDISEKEVKKFIVYENIEEKHGKTKFKSLDCSIMDLADNISFTLHDLEDALSLGMIIKDDWTEHFKGKEHIFDEIAKKHDIGEYEFEHVTKTLFDDAHFRKETIGALVNLMITNSKIVDNGSGCNCKLFNLKVELDENIEKLRIEIFELVKCKMIENKNVQQLEFKGQKLIIDLFFVFSSEPERFLPKQILDKWSAINADSDENKKKKQMRIICDFISGMTDDYATKMHDKLFSPRKGSIFDSF